MQKNLISFRVIRSPYFLIVGFSFVALILLIANPGYYSHDELQKLDHVLRYGLRHYMLSYVAISPGETFGSPIRPFSFMIQGLLALFMENYPVAVHLFAVASHALVACLLYTLVVGFGGSKKLGLLSAFIFVINPLSILATGWSAALMDRLYILFSLAALICANRFVGCKSGYYSLFLIFIFSALGILSKETAVVSPLLMLVLVFVDPHCVNKRHFWIGAGVWALPVIMFVLYRLSAIFASFGNPQVAVYKASIINVPDGLFVYLSYPFLVTLTEGTNWVFIIPALIWLAIGLHIILVVILSRFFGIKLALAYCFFYLLFLLPVLLIPMKAAHYLYGSGSVLSIAIAALLLCRSSGHFALTLTCIRYGTLGLLIAHSYLLQGFVYSLGTCMSRTMTSTLSIYLSAGHPGAINFRAEPGAPEHILHRINTNREQIDRFFPVKLSVSAWGERLQDNVLNLALNSQCIVYEMKK